MFKSGMAEAKSGKIKIPFDKDNCMVLLEYLYTGKVDASKVTADLLMEVNKILMDDLEEICLEILTKNISMDNVVDILEITDVVEAEDLQKAAEQFLVHNRKNLTKQLKEDLANSSKGMKILFKILEQY